MKKILNLAAKYAAPALVGAVLALALDRRGHVPSFLKF